MKNLIQIFAAVMLMAFNYGSQDIKGQWNGALSIQGAEYRIVFHVTKGEKRYDATMDSPDQNASGIPVTAVSFDYPNVKFEISNIGMIYEGTLSDNLITGLWKQAGRQFPLVLTLLK